MHRHWIGLWLASAFGAAAAFAAPQAEEKLPLEVLYLGNAGTPRAKDYAAFLEAHFRVVRSGARTSFDPTAEDGAQVVLLDWSQSDQDLADMKGLRSPLGERERWTKPTVLLGSAGLLIASPWRTTGAYG